MKPVVVVILVNGASACFLGDVLVASRDHAEPIPAPADIGARIAQALGTTVHEVYGMEVPSDPDWNWDDVLELLPPISTATYIIHAPSESDECDAGYWSNTEGWGPKENATEFTSDQKAAFNLPISAGNDARWVVLSSALERNVTTVPVQYWDSTHYNPDGATTSAKFAMEIGDQRQSNGQAYITLAAEGGSLDDMLCVTMEVHRLPESEVDTQCAHVHFDGDNLAFSIFKTGDQKMVLRPESGVRLFWDVLPQTAERVLVVSGE